MEDNKAKSRKRRTESPQPPLIQPPPPKSQPESQIQRKIKAQMIAKRQCASYLYEMIKKYHNKIDLSSSEGHDSPINYLIKPVFI